MDILWILRLIVSGLLINLSVQQGSCSEPPPVPNVYRIWKNGSAGSSVQYSCYDGYILLSGQLSRTCIDGKYTGEDPVCVFDCGKPKMVHGAHVNYTERVNKIGSKMSFTCWENYTQVDTQMTAPCNDYMQRWTWEPARCKSPNNLAEKASVFTLSPTGNYKDASGTTCITTNKMKDPTIRLDLITEDEFYEVSEVLFRLPENIIDLPDNISVTLRKVHSSWTIPNCGFPEAGSIIPGETILVNCSSKAIGQSVAIIGQYKNRDAVLSLCDVEIYGRLHIVDCGRPDFVYGAKALFDDTFFRSTARYECEPNFYMLSQGTQAICLFFNIWSSENIVCTNEANILQGKNVFGDGEPSVVMLTDNSDLTCTSVETDDSRIWTIELGTERYEIREIMVTIDNVYQGIWRDIFVLVDTENGRIPCEINPLRDTSSVSNTFLCPKYPVGLAIDIQFTQSDDFNFCEIRAFGNQWNPDRIFECLRSASGREYTGSQSHTISGNSCVSWTSHKGYLLNELGKISENVLSHMQNYCRNPGGVRTVPWCFTSENSDIWEYCPIPSCQRICSLNDDGSDFVGTLSVSMSGKTCQTWSLVDKARPKFPKSIFPNGKDEHNYCRNPGSSQSNPWCYTNSTSLDYEHCLLPSCPIQPLSSRKEYRDDEDVTDRFQECLLWLYEDHNRIVQETKLHLTLSKMKGLCNRTSFNITLFCSSETEPASWQYIFIHCVDDPTTTLAPTTSSAETATGLAFFNTLQEQNASSTQPDYGCGCPLPHINLSTIEIVRERIINITVELTIPKEILSATIRRKSSAGDDRPSVSCVGYAAMTILFLVILILTIPDIIQVFLFLRSAWIKQENSCSEA